MLWFARSTTCLPTGERSAVYVSSSRGPAWPRRTADSFQARLYASWMEVFEPRPFDGGCRCTASPAQNTRPTEYCSAYTWLTVHAELDVIDTLTVSSPTSLCTIERTNSSVRSGAGPLMS